MVQESGMAQIEARSANPEENSFARGRYSQRISTGHTVFANELALLKQEIAR
jgi:hypothetical protein